MEITQLQVSITAEQMTRLKATARQSGSTMTMLVREWIEGLGEGDGVVVTSSPTSSQTTSRYEELLEQQLELMAAQTKALEAQTALLERLTQQGPTVTPDGGTEPTRVVVTPSEDARPVVSTKFTGFEDHSGTDPASGGEGRRGAEDEDLVVGARVWIRPWHCWGEVREAPVGPRGPAYVKADAEGGSRMPSHFSADQLEVLVVSEPQEDGGEVDQGVAA